VKVARPVRRAGQGNPPRRKAGRAPWSDPYTYVATWSGTCYVALVIDAFSRRVLGWRAAMSMHTELVLDALEMAIWTREQAGVTDLTGLVHHTDAGSQGGFNWSSQHLDRGGVDGQASGMDEGVDGQIADESRRGRRRFGATWSGCSGAR
jgi:transposase InsO family protein